MTALANIRRRLALAICPELTAVIVPSDEPPEDAIAVDAQTPGERLAAFRASIGLSQRAFAKELGVSHGNIAMTELNNSFSRKLLKKLAAQYHLSANWLLYGAGPMAIRGELQQRKDT